LVALMQGAKVATGFLDAAGMAGIGLASLFVVCVLIRWMIAAIAPLVRDAKTTSENNAALVLNAKEVVSAARDAVLGLERCIDKCKCKCHKAE